MARPDEGPHEPLPTVPAALVGRHRPGEGGGGGTPLRSGVGPSATFPSQDSTSTSSVIRDPNVGPYPDGPGSQSISTDGSHAPFPRGPPSRPLKRSTGQGDSPTM